MTKSMLEREGVLFDETNVEEVENGEEVITELKSRGLSSMPIVEYGDEVITGFNPSKLNEMIVKVKEG